MTIAVAVDPHAALGLLGVRRRYVPALVEYPFAVVKEGRATYVAYNVTHVPTGQRVSPWHSGFKQKQARRFMACLNAQSHDWDWNAYTVTEEQFEAGAQAATSAWFDCLEQEEQEKKEKAAKGESHGTDNLHTRTRRP